ncbi:hypothetical protein MMC19_001727 [Ptychographa xylographoides]|nr:hypothetical protein [Ptychographa xylographoides]
MSSSSKPRILLLGEIEHEDAEKDWRSLSNLAELVTPKATSRADFIKECESGELDGIVATFRTFSSVTITGRVDTELIQALPKSLKYICHNGAGYDQIDVPDCTAHGIHVSNVPTAVDDATADTGIFLLIGALRGFNVPLLNLRKGEFRGKSAPALGHDPEGKLLGILGMGGIGRNMAKKLRAFGMEVQYYNRKKLSVDLEAGAKYVEFEELLKTSDVISLNLPLSPKTRHIISTPQFKLMKPGVIIINTARGAVMDEAALVSALDNGTVASVGLDVYENEPEIHPGLMSNDKVMLLPHMGTATVETQTAMEKWNISNVRMALEEGRLRSPVPEQSDMQD